MAPTVVAAPFGTGGWFDGTSYSYCIVRALSLSSGMVTQPHAAGGSAGVSLVGQDVEGAEASCWSYV